MKIILFLFALFLGSISIIFGQTHSLDRRIDLYFQDVLKYSPAPGFSVVVVRDDQVIFEKGYGLRKAGLPRPMTAQTSTAIGSLTKSFTALALMQLVEQGKVQLDDPVIRYLPEFQTANKSSSDKITVRMLLNNTSGLQGGVSQKWQYKGESPEHLMQSLQSFYVKRKPGSSYEYSNTAFSIAGLIISRVSGMSYSAYLKRYILHPLQMERSTTDPNDFEALQVLYGHRMGIHGGIPAERGIEFGEMIPAGSIFRSNAVDLGHYLIALLNGGRYRKQQIVSSQGIATLWSPQINFPGLSFEKGGDGKDFHYGLGWMISEVEGRSLIHHGGSTGTMSSMTILLPERHLAASLLINLDYNFVDRYRFQSEFSILNNLFHLIDNEKLTDFGNPRVPDPTLNDYVLPKSLKERFLGIYRFSGQGDTRNFQGVYLEVFTGQNGRLEAQTKLGGTLLSHFELDFINKVNAVSRNIAAAQSIQFKVRPDSMVTALFFGGSEFKKLLPEFLTKYQLLKSPEVSFYFSKNWTWTFQDHCFKAFQNNKPELSIAGGQRKTEVINLQSLFQQQFPHHAWFYKGVEISEVRGRYFWRQLSFATRHEETTYQHLILLNDSVGFYLILTTPFGKLTEEVQMSLSFLMDTFAHLLKLP